MMGDRFLVRTVVAVAMVGALAMACGDTFAASDFALLRARSPSTPPTARCSA